MTLEACNLVRGRALALVDDASVWQEVFDAVLYVRGVSPDLVAEAGKELLAASQRARELLPPLSPDSPERTAFNAVQAALREIELGHVTRDDFGLVAVSSWLFSTATSDKPEL
jgi:hypothetical protein